jgi:outer membrane protein assembly factor BamA
MKYTTPWQITSTAVMVSILILFLTTHVEAQNNLSNTSEPISLEGRKALQFGVGSNLTLTSADDALISYKWMTSESRGYRLNLRLNVDYENRTIDNTSVPGNSTIEQERVRNTLETNVGATFEFLRYHEVQNRLFMYTFIGPLINFRYFNRAIDDVFYGQTIDGPEVAAETRSVLKNTRIGGGGTAGIGL